jgi:hypothetical protein
MKIEIEENIREHKKEEKVPPKSYQSQNKGIEQKKAQPIFEPSNAIYVVREFPFKIEIQKKHLFSLTQAAHLI